MVASADWKSAIQQTGSLRYAFRLAKPVKYPGSLPGHQPSDCATFICEASHCFMAAPLSFEVCGSAGDGHFGEPVLFLDLFFAVAVGEVARWPDGNGVYRGDLLQNEAVFPAHDAHGLALAGLFHQFTGAARRGWDFCVSIEEPAIVY